MVKKILVFLSSLTENYVFFYGNNYAIFLVLFKEVLRTFFNHLFFSFFDEKNHLLFFLFVILIFSKFIVFILLSESFTYSYQRPIPSNYNFVVFGVL